MAFTDIKGHEKTLGALKGMLESGRVPPALIFAGPDGVGKLLAAKEFAKALNCSGKPAAQADEGGLFGAVEPPPVEEKTEKPCGLCESCLQAARNVHPDMRVIDSDFQGLLLDEEAKKQRTLKIETVREFTKYVYQRAILSPWKVFIVNDAHTLNVNAQNAMLKCLEEPPENTVFILVASQKQFLLPTIISRGHSVNFRPLPAETLTDILAAQGVPLDEAAKLGALAGGSVKKALDTRKLLAKLSAIPPMEAGHVYKIAGSLPKELYLARETAARLLEIVTLKARNKWRAAEGAKKDSCLRLLQRLAEARRMLSQNVSPSLLLETALTEAEKNGVTIH